MALGDFLLKFFVFSLIVINYCIIYYYSTLRLNSTHLYSPKLEKLVFIVIDALRADFILNDNLHKTMPFLHSLHENSLACSYLAQAHTPTVTLPRIKSLVTGGVPSFSDVIFNLGSSKMEDKENIIHKLESIGKKIVFYGDETCT